MFDRKIKKRFIVKKFHVIYPNKNNKTVQYKFTQRTVSLIKGAGIITVFSFHSLS